MIRKIGDWYFKVRPCRDCSSQFIAWAAKTPMLKEGPLELPPASDVHFAFGPSAEAAMELLRQEVMPN